MEFIQLPTNNVALAAATIPLFVAEHKSGRIRNGRHGMPRLSIIVWIALVALSVVGIRCAYAQNYPVKPVHIIVPYPAGGFADALARLMGKKLSEKRGQSVVVESKVGATGMIGTEYVARSPADGYTLLMGSTAELALNVAVYDKVTYDPEHDLAAVVLLSESPMVLVVNPNVPAKTLADFIALGKEKPEGISYATAGSGSPQHVAGAWLKEITKANLIHVPYRGGPQQVVAIISGEVQCGFVSLPNAAPHLQSGKLRALAVLSGKRLALFPDIPTMDEAGVHGIDVRQWRGIVAPAGTPKDIVTQLNADFMEALRSREAKELLAVGGEEALGSSPEEFAKFMRSEIVKFKKVAKELNISTK